MRPIVQMSGDWEEFHTEAGIPCGSVTGLTATMQKRIIRWLYCVPACVGKVKDAAAKYYLALRLSLPRKVGMIIAANPSTLINLARAGDQEKETLIRDLHDGTLSAASTFPPTFARRCAASVETAARAAARAGGDRRPHRHALSRRLLAHGLPARQLDRRQRRRLPAALPRVFRRDAGARRRPDRQRRPHDDPVRRRHPGGVLDITSHYFEFIPEDEIDSPQPTVLGAHEVQEGQQLLHPADDGFGLYRYHIPDLVARDRASTTARRWSSS